MEQAPVVNLLATFGFTSACGVGNLQWLFGCTAAFVMPECSFQEFITTEQVAEGAKPRHDNQPKVKKHPYCTLDTRKGSDSPYYVHSMLM